jgi:DNA repair protein RadD
MLTLRPYQQEALAAVYDHIRRRDDNPCVVLPTGAGKTPCLAQLCHDAVTKWGGRVLVLSHVKELLEQATAHLASYLPVNMVGLHSAGLGRRDTTHPVIAAGIQTVANLAGELGAFDVIVIDEAHLIPESGEGRYRTFLADAKIVNPNVRLVGLTATPFRLGTGRICKPENLLNHVCYEANVKELILAGWLSPLRTRRGSECADISHVKITPAGEYATDEMQAAFEAVIKPACEEILALTADRRSVLVFAAGVEHARLVAETLGGEAVTGDTPRDERARLIAAFRRGEIRYLANVNVLTTGFDAPNVDAVVLLRATMSAGLYSQMVGRGLRKAAGKTDCLVLDYGDNALRHGPIDRIKVRDRKKRDDAEAAPGKECPNCHEVIAAQYRVCPVCEYEFPFDPTPSHGTRAGDAPILSEDVVAREMPVLCVGYSQHVKHKDEGDSVTLRVQYWLSYETNLAVSEFLCFGHTSKYARDKAAMWWRERSMAPVPATVMDALALAHKGALAEPSTITIVHKPGDKYPEIVGFSLPDPPHFEWTDQEDEEFFDVELVGVDPNDISF